MIERLPRQVVCLSRGVARHSSRRSGFRPSFNLPTRSLVTFDLKQLARNPEDFKAALAERGCRLNGNFDSLINDIGDLAGKRRERDELNGHRNRLAGTAGDKREEARRLRDRRARLTEEIQTLEARIETAVGSLPNLAHPTVPDGEGEQDNVCVGTWETPRPLVRAA